MERINLDGMVILSLVSIPKNESNLTRLKFLNHLNRLYKLDYPFTESNLKYWNISPIYLKDPEDKRRSVVRLTALNGNGKFSGYRDFIYNRMDVGDYLSSLSELTHMSDRYKSVSLRETVKDLIAQEFSDGEVSISEEINGDLTTYTVTVIDENSLLWYGSGSITVGDIPDISTVIPINSFVMSD